MKYAERLKFKQLKLLLKVTNLEEFIAALDYLDHEDSVDDSQKIQIIIQALELKKAEQESNNKREE